MPGATETVTADGNGVSRTFTSNGNGSSHVNSSEEYHNTGVAKIYTDQGNFEVFQKDLYIGCNGGTIIQTNGDRCEITGGRHELRCEGSRYTIVGDADSYFYHPMEAFDRLNSELLAYRSGFGDDRNDFDPSKLLPSISMKLPDISLSVLNQTNNNVKYPKQPEKTGSFLIDLLAALAWDMDCAIYRALR